MRGVASDEYSNPVTFATIDPRAFLEKPVEGGCE